MNLNIVGYFVYLTFTATVIVKVGAICYHNGNSFIRSLLKDQVALSVQINKTLLIGYYLLNIGYACSTLVRWDSIGTPLSLLEIISRKIAIILLIIAILHYINLFLLQKIIQKIL